ncbi:MAG: hypothetical protein LBI39_02720 [Puniceicoccales bacterium]|jgi:hypothetical protein|nr:hypothetical protein [Puniceicoccales bacterium]
MGCLGEGGGVLCLASENACKQLDEIDSEFREIGLPESATKYILEHAVKCATNVKSVKQGPCSVDATKWLHFDNIAVTLSFIYFLEATSCANFALIFTLNGVSANAQRIADAP